MNNPYYNLLYKVKVNFLYKALNYDFFYKIDVHIFIISGNNLTLKSILNTFQTPKTVVYEYITKNCINVALEEVINSL